jgi:hypothetical protein
MFMESFFNLLRMLGGKLLEGKKEKAMAPKRASPFQDDFGWMRFI